MSESPPIINTVAVAGAGLMGAGIAYLSVLAGYKTILYDVNQQALISGMLRVTDYANTAVKLKKIEATKAIELQNSIQTTTNPNLLIADLIIEAVLEQLPIKINLFNQLAQINAPHTIFASNTSSIPITQIAAQIPNPHRVVGMHFFNPAPVMKLVEVIQGVSTSTETALTVAEVAKKMGKQVAFCADSPGFIVNRVARPYYTEGLKLLEENIAPLEIIDDLCQATGFKMGPFRLMDLIGIETNFAVTSTMYQQFFYEQRFKPNRIQQQKVDAGHFGRKTKQGFYTYD